MADYYPVLKRAISSLPSGSGEARRAVYEKARIALLRQLSSYNPPLSPAEIADQRVALEDCIRRVEAEVAGGSPEAVEAPSDAAPQAPAPAPEAKPEPKPAPKPEPKPEPVVAPKVEPRGLPRHEPRVDTPSESQPGGFHKAVPASLMTPEMNPFRHVEPLSQRGAEPAGRVEPPLRAEPEVPKLSLPTAAPERSRQQAARLPDGQNEPRIGVSVSALTRTLKQADTLGGASATAARAARHAMEDVSDTPADGDAAMRPELAAPPSERLEPQRLPQREGATLPWTEESAGSANRGRLIIGALAVALVLLVGTGVFAYRDSLTSLIAGAPETEAAATPAEGADGLSPKILDRLPVEGETPAEPVAPDAVAVQTETVAAANVDPDLPPPPAAGETAATPAAPTMPEAVAEPLAPVATPPAAASEAVVGVAQKAILYEEPIPGSPGTKLDGSVVWSFVNEPTLPGEKPVPQIRGDISVPSLKLKMRLSIHKNDDAALPASHIVEFGFDVPADFSGKFIDTTPGMIAKQTEEARGDPVVGAVAKVSDSLFWLALSGLDQDVTRNVQLLKERSWIDIPIRYGNRRRAILTFEKGVPGEKAFADAFAAWGQ